MLRQFESIEVKNDGPYVVALLLKAKLTAGPVGLSSCRPTLQCM